MSIPITIAAAIEQNAAIVDTLYTMVANPPVPNEPNPALPPGDPIDSDDDVELIDYNEGLGPEEVAAIEAAKVQATKYSH
jgi:hypothetical protein